MQHPLFSSKTAFGMYILAWVILISIQTLSFFQLFSVSWFYAVIDSLLFGSIYFFIGIGVWYFIRYASFEKNQLFPLILEHLASAFVLVSIWVYSGTYILAHIFSLSPDYVNLLWGTIGWRYGNGFLLYIILIIVYYLYANSIRQQQRKEKELKLHSSLQNAEIDLFRSKLNPHFLFNSLNSLNALIQTEPENASKMLLQLSDFLRFSIEKNKQEKIDLKDELVNLERYMAIEHVRFGNRLKFNKNIQEKALDLKLPAMLLQPLLENAIKYGLGSELGDVDVKIKAKESNTNLLIEVCNTYDKSVNVKKGSGQGIDNVRKRLNIIYKNAADFRLEKTDNLFKVNIIIPQTDNDETA